MLLSAAGVSGYSQVRFHKGINLTSWFQTDGAHQIQFTRYTKTDFENIQSLGCDVIRLPINLHAMTGGAPDYIFDPVFYRFLDSAVSWAEDLHLFLILDNHSFDPSVNTDPGIGDVLNKVWKQMAEHYKDRSDYIIYEILNEPHGIDDQVWSRIQGDAIKTIRSIDTKHTIIAGPASYNSYNVLKYMTVYDDDNIIYTFHFYDPFVFTHQGASWTDPPMVSLAGVPFPYDASRMPACPPDLAGTWINSALNDYPSQGNTEYVKSLLDIAIDFRKKNNVPLFCGEFGVLDLNCTNDDRVQWYEAVRKYLEENDIAWTTWDYQGGFGLFEKGTDALFDYDLNTPLLSALGFNIPPQSTFQPRPDSTGFNIYTDFIGNGLVESGAAGSGQIDFYSSDGPIEGQYCLHWTGGEQYTQVGFDMVPNKDLSLLVDEGYEISGWLRGTPGLSFDIRFIDTRTGDPGDHPWRMDYTVDQSKVPMDNKWHFIRIPLGDFSEQGSYDNGIWYTPEGKFDWHAVDRLEIVAETRSLAGMQAWFDNLQIDYPVISGIRPANAEPGSITLFPNPFTGNLNVRFSMTNPTTVDFSLTNIDGRIVSEAKQTLMPGGNYILPVLTSGHPVPPGVYLFSFNSGDRHWSRKVIRIR